ncbi:MAG: hypothetical protein PHG23_02805 [Candidatus Pacebacteria bacterium]|nr:hypothetical protein [Candidatus Paceibacterota bacterium]
MKKNIITIQQIAIISIFCINPFLLKSIFANETNLKPSNYPLIEIQGGLGLAWLGQSKIGINILDKYYARIRGSETIAGLVGATEYGFSAGFLFNKTNIGIGYSKGMSFAGDPNGNSSEDHWDAFVLEAGYTFFFNKDFLRLGINFDTSFTIGKGIFWPSFNICLVFGLL